MQQDINSAAILKKRKSLIILPLIVVPFIAFLFWSLGGGKSNGAYELPALPKGFNMALPDANLTDDKSLDKMSYYDKAAADSAKLKEQMKNDPYYQNHEVFAKGEKSEVDTALIRSTTGLGLRGSGSNIYNDPNEAKVYKKLDQLNAALNQPSASPSTGQDHESTTSIQSNNTLSSKADVDRLEQMIKVMNQKTDQDPEMQQLDNILGKIIDIQHPENLQEKIRQSSEKKKGQVFAVSTSVEQHNLSYLDTSRTLKAPTTGFYSLESRYSRTNEANAIEAVIHETQTLFEGSTVKLRLMADIYVNGTLIPKNTFLFGTCALNGERLSVKINSIRFKNSLFPVDMSVYDMDGMSGIYIRGAINRDVAKQSSDRAIQSIGINTLDPSLKVQAAAAGLEAAKGLLSKKVKLIRVTVKAGYQLLLRDEKQIQNN